MIVCYIISYPHELVVVDAARNVADHQRLAAERQVLFTITVDSCIRLETQQ